MRRDPCEATYWQENNDWYLINGNGEIELKEEAPELAKISLQAYKMCLPDKPDWDYLKIYMNKADIDIIKDSIIEIPLSKVQKYKLQKSGVPDILIQDIL